MDAFEQVIAEIFWKEGYWVQTSVKVNLSKEQKRRLENPSMPRPEIDVLAYSSRDNTLKAIECKSFLDSRGVIAADVGGSTGSSRYKLFRNEALKDAVLQTLKDQLVATGACPADVRVVLCLACGKIASETDRLELRSMFSARGWELFDDQWISKKIQSMAEVGYENQISTVVTKLLKNHFRIEND
jgi:hypothetical protein